MEIDSPLKNAQAVSLPSPEVEKASKKRGRPKNSAANETAKIQKDKGESIPKKKAPKPQKRQRPVDEEFDAESPPKKARESTDSSYVFE